MAIPEPFETTLQTWIEVFMRRSMRAYMLYVKERGLSMSQMGAMFHVHHRGACRVSDVGDELGVTDAAASQMLERLVQQGLITRSEDRHDRRLKQIILTDLGRQALHESILARQKWLVLLAARMSPQEKEQVRAALEILIDKTLQVENLSEENIPAILSK